MPRGTVRVGASGEDLFKLAADLRRAGARSLQRELYRAVQRAGKRVVVAAKDGAQTLPRSGGLAARVASATYRTQLKGGRNPGVRVTATEKTGKPVDLNSIDRTGNVRHPLYGNRRHWYATRAPAGWFTTPATQAAEAARDDIEAAVTAIEKEITGR
jgi:hypothetical protein